MAGLDALVARAASTSHVIHFFHSHTFHQRTGPSVRLMPKPMNIAIVGAGIIGVTTAYELAADGHAVTVFERRGTVAEEASFANAGFVSPGSVMPWASPTMRRQLLINSWGRHAPMKLLLPLSLTELRWMGRWWLSGNAATHHLNRSRMQRLARYSQLRLQALSGQHAIACDPVDGVLTLLRTSKTLQRAQPGLELLRQTDTPFTLLDEQQARALEPALNPDTRFAGAIHLPRATVANCRQFALGLKTVAQRQGVSFAFNQPVALLDKADPRRLWLQGQAEPRTFDAVVVCAGAESVRLLRPLGLRLPLIGVWGYSVSAHVKEPQNAPRSAVTDEHYKVAISRLGQRVRVAGSAIIGDGKPGLRSGALQTLYKVLQDWFPGAATLSGGVQEWKGARPMLPDGPPVIGPSGMTGLWLNLGHGASGWALACGSARLLADQIAGRPPEIDPEGLGLARVLG